jgi:hypothetical protein
MSGLTPRELTRLFPIEKYYDGNKCGDKDYFYTIDIIKKMGMDAIIGENVSELLFDYQNKYIRKYALFKMNIVDILRKLQGQSSMVGEFMKKHEVVPLTIFTGDDNKKYIFDPKTETTTQVKKVMPRYLRPIKNKEK